MKLFFLTLWCLISGFGMIISAEAQAQDRLNIVNTSTKTITGENASSDSFKRYQLDTGDKIKIHVFGEKDLNITVRLGPSGNIRYPFLGRIHVAGMTLHELERKITRGLAVNYLINPQVSVLMVEFRLFYVNGKVEKPGAYPYQPGLTVRKAISLAGGFDEDADRTKLFLIRAGHPREHGFEVSPERRIQPGDILTIKQSFFFMSGEVKKPGKYPYQVGLTYRMAISLAGGLKEKGDKNKVFVLHKGLRKAPQRLDSLDAMLRSGDVITVKQSFF